MRRLIPLFLLLALIGCRKEENTPADSGYAYFPLETGRYVVYDVEEITFNFGQGGDTALYQLKEQVADTFAGLEGVPKFKIDRYRRNTASDPWQIDSVWNAYTTSFSAIKVENNVPFIKIAFPVKNRLTWNGNAWNNIGDDEFQITGLHMAENLGGIAFSRVLTVTQDNFESLINKSYKIEKYASGVGLVYKEEQVYEYCQTDPSCFGTIESGRYLKMTVNEYGLE